MQGAVISPILHQAVQALLSLPSFLVYGGGAVLSLLTMLLATRVWSSVTASTEPQFATPQQSQSSTTTGNATETAGTTSAPPETDVLVDSKEPENDSEVRTTDEDESTESVKEGEQVSSTQNQPIPTIDTLPTDQKPVPSKDISRRTPSPGRRLVTTSSSRSRRYSNDCLATSSIRSQTVTNRLSLRREVRRHLIDPFQIETGVDPISLDPSWGLIKVDLSFTGISADTGYELIYLNLQPAPVSYEAIESPVELTVSTLVRRFVQDTPATPSTETQTVDQDMVKESQQGPQNNRLLREQSHHRHVNDGQNVRDEVAGQPGQQVPVETTRGIEQRRTPSRHEKPPRDCGLEPHEPLRPSTTTEPNSWPHDSNEDLNTPLATGDEQFQAIGLQNRLQTSTLPYSDVDHHLESHVDDSVFDLSYTPETGQNQTSSRSGPKQLSESVGLKPLPRWERPEFEPLTPVMEEGNIPGKSTVEVSTQPHKPDNPLAESGRGCDSIDADNIFGEPLGQEMNTVWEEEPLDLETSTFDGETDEVVNDLEFSPGFTVDDDIMPI